MERPLISDRFYRVSLTFVVALTACLTLPCIGQTPPLCTPAPPLQTLAIPYSGLTSGCSNVSGSPACIAGETVQFKVGDGIRLTDCPTEYLWQFEGPTVAGAATMNRSFSGPGTFTVTLKIIDRLGTIELSQVVTLISNAAIPTLSEALGAMLVLSLLFVGFYRLR